MSRLALSLSHRTQNLAGGVLRWLLHLPNSGLLLVAKVDPNVSYAAPQGCLSYYRLSPPAACPACPHPATLIGSSAAQNLYSATCCDPTLTHSPFLQNPSYAGNPQKIADCFPQFLYQGNSPVSWIQDFKSTFISLWPLHTA